VRKLQVLGTVCFVGAAVVLQTGAASAEEWSLVVPESLSSDAAVALAVEDLVETGAALGHAFSVRDDRQLPAGNAILVGGPARNAQAKALAESGILKSAAPDHEQGYTLETVALDGRRIISVAGGSVIGDVYGLYWLWDRLRVHRALPDLNTTRVPALPIRKAGAWGRMGRSGNSKEAMHEALRRSLNWVSGPNVLDLVPWDSEPERTANAATRERTRELIEYAHALHMKYFSFSNDFTFHPSLLKEHGATLDPCDPKLWDAVQDKYRKLFQALPELDGIDICNDDISGFWDDYQAYDILHENPACEISYTKRFRTFVQKVHDVVVGEFNKTYFHFTWGLTMHEQHYQPAVYREIFTDAVPRENLYLVPKITAADRWWYQPYNETFNQTPHETLVCFETMNYYEGGKSHLFPTFSGQYFQNGIQYVLLPENHNVCGTSSMGSPSARGWDTVSAYAYVLYRLGWDPYDDIEQIARDFCAIHFGPDAAEGMAEIYLKTPSAYQYGLHIGPISYGQFNSFLHMRVGTFPVEGYPTIDGGKEHLQFLRKIYLRSNPWRAETLKDLEYGLSVAEDMRAKYGAVRDKIADPALAKEMAERLDMTRHLIATNFGYVRLLFAYFDYFDRASDKGREALRDAYDGLRQARETFTQAPGFSYQLFGVDQLLQNAGALLENREAALAAYEAAPMRSAIEATVAEQQRLYADVLQKHADKAVKFAEFEIKVDGQDLVHISGDQHRVEHLRWDGPEVRRFEILAPLPKEAVTVVPKDLYSRPMHPFVLEQPSAANDYTVSVYLDDLPGGQDWFRAELYYLPGSPEQYGLQVPWKK
jgi:hypothetical protein